MRRHEARRSLEPRRLAALFGIALLIFVLQYITVSNVDPSGMASTADNVSLLPVRSSLLYRVLRFISPVVLQPLRGIVRAVIAARGTADPRLISYTLSAANIRLAHLGLAAANSIFWLTAITFLAWVGRGLAGSARRRASTTA